jgi:hypothetical protein
LLANDGGSLVSGSPIRQEYLETALSWINNEQIEEYMAKHQHDEGADKLWQYFQNVIHWVRNTFPNYRKEMANVNWGELYNEFKSKIQDDKFSIPEDWQQKTCINNCCKYLFCAVHKVEIGAVNCSKIYYHEFILRDY